MGNVVRAVVIGALIGSAAPALAQQAKPAPETEKTLYQRLGGYDAIAAVTDDFLGRMLADPRLSRFFSGLSTDSRNRVRQLIVDLLCRVADGPCNYTGRAMKTTHTGLGITAADWQQAATLLTASLDKFHVAKREKEDVLGYVGLLRPDIVEK
jgi:hemoglobin